MGEQRIDALFEDLFRGLAVAWRALSAYPSGHPAAAEGLGRALAALTPLLAETGAIDLGAARDQLLWLDQRFRSPPAAQLAKLLRRRRAAGVTFQPGATAGELETLLRALATHDRQSREGGSLAADLAAAGLVHVRVSDLDLSSLALVDADEETSAPEAGAFASRVVRRLLARNALPAEEAGKWVASGRTAADLLRFLFDEGGAAGAFGPAARASALRAAAEELGESPDREGAEAVAALHGQLRGGDGGRLLEEIAAAMARRPSAREAVAQLSAVLPPQAVADLRAAVAKATAGGRGDAGAPEAALARMAPAQIATLRRAFAEDDVDTFREAEAPIEELAALLELPEDRVPPGLSEAAARIGRALAAPGLEVGAIAAMVELAERAEVPAESLPGILRRIEAPYRRLLSEGRLRDAARLAERFRRRGTGEGPAPAAFRESLERMSDAEAMRSIAAALPGMRGDALGAFPALVGFLAPGAIANLLDASGEIEDRRMHARFLDLLAKLGWVVARDAEARLSDPRWSVVRDMLQLLRRVGDVKSVPAVRRCVDHPDLRVRLEAIHNLFAFDGTAPRELLEGALHDPDPRQAEAAMELVGQYGIAEAVPPIVAYLSARDPFGRRRAVRLKAIRALGAIGDPAALDGLGHFRGRIPLLRPALEERRELYRTLPGYPAAARQPWIESGRRSLDPEIRRLSGVMKSEEEAAP
jgi:HEAT repeat protein